MFSPFFFPWSSKIGQSFSGTAILKTNISLAKALVARFLFLPRSLALPKNGSIKIPEIVFFKYFYISRYLLYFFPPPAFRSSPRPFGCRNIYFSSPREILSLRHFFNHFFDRLKSRFGRAEQSSAGPSKKHSAPKEIFHSWKRSRRKLHHDGSAMCEFLLHYVEFQFRWIRFRFVDINLSECDAQKERSKHKRTWLTYIISQAHKTNLHRHYFFDSSQMHLEASRIELFISNISTRTTANAKNMCNCYLSFIVIFLLCRKEQAKTFLSRRRSPHCIVAAHRQLHREGRKRAVRRISFQCCLITILPEHVKKNQQPERKNLS